MNWSALSVYKLLSKHDRYWCIIEVKCYAQGFLERGDGRRRSQTQDSFWFVVVEIF